MMPIQILDKKPIMVVDEISRIRYVKIEEDEEADGGWEIRYEGKKHTGSLGNLSPHEFSETRGEDELDEIEEGDVGTKIEYSGYRSVDTKDIAQAVEEYEVYRLK